MNVVTAADAKSPSRAAQVRRFGPAVVLVAALAVFVAQNTRTVSARFLWLSFDAPLWLVLVIFAVVGVLIGGIVGYRRRR